MGNICDRFNILLEPIQVIHLGYGCQKRIFVYVAFIFADGDLMVLIDRHKVHLRAVSLVCEPDVIHRRELHIGHNHFLPGIIQGIGNGAYKV